MANPALDALSGLMAARGVSSPPAKAPAEVKKAATTKKPVQKKAPTSKKTNKTSDTTTRKSSTDSRGREDRGLGKNQDGTYRQSAAGRKSIDAKEKKVQLVVTLMPGTSDRLKEWASSKSRSATNYLSEYIDDNLDKIISHFDGK